MVGGRFETGAASAYASAMSRTYPDAVTVLHDRVPNRIRFRVPWIRNRQAMADLLKHSLLHDPEARGIYHAEPNITTGSLLVKFHPALETSETVILRVKDHAQRIADGRIALSAKHRNPKLGKMKPGAFFTRELLVSVVGNVLGGLILAALVMR